MSLFTSGYCDEFGLAASVDDYGHLTLWRYWRSGAYVPVDSPLY